MGPGADPLRGAPARPGLDAEVLPEAGLLPEGRRGTPRAVVEQVRGALELPEGTGPHYESVNTAKLHRKLVRKRQGISYDQERARKDAGPGPVDLPAPEDRVQGLPRPIPFRDVPPRRAGPATRSRRRPAAGPSACTPSPAAAVTPPPGAPTVRLSDPHEPPKDRSTMKINISNMP